MDAHTEHCKQNQGGGSEAYTRPRPTPSEKLEDRTTLRRQHAEVAAKPLPVVLQIKLRNRLCGEDAQRLRNGLREISALRATFQMPGDSTLFRAFMKLIRDQLFFREVFHRRPPGTGVSDRRSLLTARKTACLAELLVTLSAAAISAIGTSSICRSVNAVRSIGVNSAIAACRRLTI